MVRCPGESPLGFREKDARVASGDHCFAIQRQRVDRNEPHRQRDEETPATGR